MLSVTCADIGQAERSSRCLKEQLGLGQRLGDTDLQAQGETLLNGLRQVDGRTYAAKRAARDQG